MARVWPVAADDGRVQVAARFRLIGDFTLDDSRAEVGRWAAMVDESAAELLLELDEDPSVDAVTPDRVVVSIKAKPDSRHWKDLLVWVTDHLRSVDGLAFDGFIDLVTGVVHPGSVPGGN